MIKRNIKLFTALLTVALIAGATLFFACQKDDNSKQTTNNADITEFVEKDYKDYIEELIATTGIDIYELSQLEKVQKMADETLNVMNAGIEASQTKGNFTEEILAYLQALKAEINETYAAGDEAEALRLYEHFCTICRMTGYFQFSQYGVPIFTFDPDNPFVIAINQAEELFEDIGNNYPQFSSFSEETQIDIIAAAIFLKIQDPDTKGAPTDCKKEAALMYAVSASVATASLQAGLMSCAFAGPGAPACCAVAGAAYGVAMGVAYWQYRRAVARC